MESDRARNVSRARLGARKIGFAPAEIGFAPVEFGFGLALPKTYVLVSARYIGFVSQILILSPVGPFLRPHRHTQTRPQLTYNRRDVGRVFLPFKARGSGRLPKRCSCDQSVLRVRCASSASSALKRFVPFAFSGLGDGAVRQIAVHTVGDVVTPAQPLMVVVPAESRLEIEAMVKNQDIGFVRAGAPAEIKVDTFNFTRYGLIHGTVVSISQDAVRAREATRRQRRQRRRRRRWRSRRASSFRWKREQCRRIGADRMAFTYDPGRQAAVDAVSNSLLRCTPVHLDVKNLHLYEFVRDGFVVRFEVFIVSERRSYRWKGEERLGWFDICACIFRADPP